MPVEPGQKLSHYRLVEKIGEGGMGVVWKAVDTTLDREVAIKVLPEALASDPHRLERFEREAKLLASLNHARIASLHGLHEAEGVRFLSMELIHGEDLSQHLTRGPMAVEQAQRIALQVAEGLEAAHESGIIHRDLKPANIKLTTEGDAKILDFGLAKALRDPMSGSEVDLSQSPTMTAAATQAGVILGTASYMSPEQARGQRVDKRSDIWAFGCVLYEMLTGRRAFGGGSVTDTLAAVLTTQPDWERLPAKTPSGVHRLLRRCLDPDPHSRLRDIGEARVALDRIRSGTKDGALEPMGSTTTASARGSNRLAYVAFSIAALAIMLAIWLPRRDGTRPSNTPVRLSIRLAPDTTLELTPSSADFALSPRGDRVVYVGLDPERRSNLFSRRLDSFESHVLPETEGAKGPFFSPDGEWVAFFAADGKLKKTSLSGGTPITLCDASLTSLGGTWGEDGTVVFAPRGSTGLARVSSEGGISLSFTELNTQSGESSHGFPQLLPDGKTVLFTIGKGSSIDEAEIAVVPLSGGKTIVVHRGGTQARYVPTGHLVYGTTTGLVAVRFDLSRLKIVGPPKSAVEDVFVGAWFGAAHYSFSTNGTLAFATGRLTQPQNRLIWVTDDGAELLVTPDVLGFTWGPRISPDERRLATSVFIQDRTEIWLYDLQRRVGSPLVAHNSHNVMPIWTPDGNEIVFASNRSGNFDMYRVSTDGDSEAKRIGQSEVDRIPTSFRRDGELLAFYEINPSTQRDLWIMPLDGDRAPSPFLIGPSDERAPMFSPNGRWIAYVSNESGRDEVYLTAFPEPGGKTRVSSDGGVEPYWSRDGKNLYYRNGRGLYVVEVTSGNSVRVGSSRLLFEGEYVLDGNGNPGYDVDSSGRFLFIRGQRSLEPTEIFVVMNWFKELEKL
jgi:serine/threonine protein kinase